LDLKGEHMPLAHPQTRAAADAKFWRHPQLQAVETLMKSASIGQQPSHLSDIAKDHLTSGGKRFRALMSLHAGDLLRVSPEESVCWAASVELLHNATLVHDDLQDGDPYRREKPTVWKKYGAGQAINAGDLLLMVPYHILSRMETSAENIKMLLNAFAHRTIETVRGQSLEMTLKESYNFDRETYIRSLRGKTGQLLALAVEGPMIISATAEAPGGQIADCFESLGIAFQILDDLRDLYADKGRKQMGNDLREGKVSALTIAHLEKCPEETLALREVLQKPFEDVTQKEIEFWKRRFKESNAPERCADWAASFVNTAIRGASNQPLQPLIEQTAAALGLKGDGVLS